MLPPKNAAPRRPLARSSAADIAPYAALLVAVLLVGGLFQTNPGRELLRDAGLLGRPTSYTELAFTDPRTLPSELIPSQDMTGLQFSVRNATTATRVYGWSVSVTKPSSAAAATPATAAGTVRLTPGQRTTVAPVLRSVRCIPGAVSVSVSLSGGTNEIIRYQATCTTDSEGAGGQAG